MIVGEGTDEVVGEIDAFGRGETRGGRLWSGDGRDEGYIITLLGGRLPGYPRSDGWHGSYINGDQKYSGELLLLVCR